MKFWLHVQISSASQGKQTLWKITNSQEALKISNVEMSQTVNDSSD